MGECGPRIPAVGPVLDRCNRNLVEVRRKIDLFLEIVEAEDAVHRPVEIGCEPRLDRELFSTLLRRRRRETRAYESVVLRVFPPSRDDRDRSGIELIGEFGLQPAVGQVLEEVVAADRRQQCEGGTLEGLHPERIGSGAACAAVDVDPRGREFGLLPRRVAEKAQQRAGRALAPDRRVIESKSQAQTVGRFHQHLRAHRGRFQVGSPIVVVTVSRLMAGSKPNRHPVGQWYVDRPLDTDLVEVAVLGL